MLSRSPRQIVGLAVDKSVNKEALQEIADRAPFAGKYCTDGCPVYCDVVFGGRHVRNLWDKADTHNIESSNADLRHYIKGLSRKSRCFFRSLETLNAVLGVFVSAYNKFGEMKEKTKKAVNHRSSNKHLHKWRYPTFSLLDFL
jgi:coenzyme F420-reducing hydrogenase beta subunit